MEDPGGHPIGRRGFVARGAQFLVGGIATTLVGGCGPDQGGGSRQPGGTRSQESSLTGRGAPAGELRSSASRRNAPRGTGGVRPSAAALEASLRIDPVSIGGRTINPNQVVRVGGLPAVEDQGDRGTCVAFAFTTLHEHALRRRNVQTELSQQHLYHECKLRDGLGCDDGTTMDTAAGVLAEVGQCTAATAPYRQAVCDNDLGNVQAARNEARRFRLRTTEINPRELDGMARILQRGWPVAVLVDVHAGWDSSEAWESGSVQLPAGEINGAHAICLIAYTENPVQPFPRGHFAFRNSWGTRFGRNTRLSNVSFSGQGCGVMPWEYIGQHCYSAFTPSDALR